MKKILALMFVFTFFVNLTACSSSKSQTEPEVKSDSETSEESSAGVEVDKDLLTVDITLPASLAGAVDDDFDPDTYAEENNFQKAVINEDGSITVTMTKTTHEALMKNTYDEYVEMVEDMIESEDTPYIKDIDYADDLSSFKVSVNRAEYENSYDFTALSLGLMGSMYQTFAGEEMNVEISILDADTGETISESVYPKE